MPDIPHEFDRRRWRLVAAAIGWMAAIAAMSASAQPATGPAEPATASAPASAPASQPGMTAEQVQQIHDSRLEQIDEGDTDGLYQLAQFCAANRRPDLAARLCERILAVRPAHARARELLQVSTRRMAASRLTATTQSAATARSPASAGSPAPAGQVLNAQSMSRLRFHEFHPHDLSDRPRVRISRAVAAEFVQEMLRAGAMPPDDRAALDRTAFDRAAFERADNDDKLREMIIRSGNRYVDRVELTSDPQALVAFRQKVWPILARGCATPACHGGPDGGNLRFVVPATHLPAGHTNFYIASTYADEVGWLVDRERPEVSLLLQYGLPTETAWVHHPTPVPPLFANEREAKYQTVLEWIRSLERPAPDYGITPSMWQPMPGAAGATQPAAQTQPASAATQPQR